MPGALRGSSRRAPGGGAGCAPIALTGRTGRGRVLAGRGCGERVMRERGRARTEERGRTPQAAARTQRRRQQHKARHTEVHSRGLIDSCVLGPVCA